MVYHWPKGLRPLVGSSPSSGLVQVEEMAPGAAPATGAAIERRQRRSRRVATTHRRARECRPWCLGVQLCQIF